MSASDNRETPSGLGARNASGTYDYTHVLGRLAKLLPGGESTSFDALLPVHGTLSRQVALEDWGSDWLVLSLEQSLCVGGNEYHHVLVRSRWAGVPIGVMPCSVFVLLDPRGAALKGVLLRSSDFEQAPWSQIEVQDERSGT